MVAAAKYKTRHALIRDLRETGAFDDATLKSVDQMKPADARAWFEKNVDLAGYTGADIEALWTKKVTISIDADAGEEVDVVTPDGPAPEEALADDPEDDPEDEPVGKGRKRRVKSDPGFGARLAKAGSNFGKPMGPLVAREKAYDACVKGGMAYPIRNYGMVRPAFVNGEKAAAAGAAYRQRLIQLYPDQLANYSKAEDVEILKHHGIDVKAHGTDVNSLGGALVNEFWSPDLIDLPSEYGAVRRAVGVMSRPNGETIWVRRKRAEFEVADLNENGTITGQNKPTFDTVKLEFSKKGGMAVISNELLNDDAIGIGEVLTRDIQRGFDKYLDDSVLLGSNGYNGMDATAFTTDGTDHIDANLAGGTANWYAGYTVATIERLWGKIPSAAWAEGGIAGVCHRAFFAEVLARFGASAASQSDSGTGLYNGTVPMASGPGGFYRGLPIYFSDSMPSTYSANQISFVVGSFSGAAKVAEVTGTDIAQSEHIYFDKDQVAFRATRRMAINTHNVGGSATDGKKTMVIGLKD